MVDKRMLEHIEHTLGQLAAPVAVLEKNDDRLPVLVDGEIIEHGDSLYLAVRRPGIVLCCKEEVPGAQEMLRLSAALCASLAAGEHHTQTVYDVYRRTLSGDLAGTELEAMAHEYQIPHDMHRCVMVFRIVHTDKERAFDLLEDITPLEERDVLIDVDKHTVALIKDVTDVESMDELAMYAQALQETLMGETAHRMTVGVGRSRNTLEEIRESYDEARKAIEVGRVFQPEQSIYVFSSLILERFLLELPQDISAYYHSLLFNRRTSRLFNEEMLYTIDMFFKKDLNLSDTARQLYIHRNTLVYRLDKVQRQTGLDLRSFDDAVTFKILMELKKCSGDKLSGK